MGPSVPGGKSTSIFADADQRREADIARADDHARRTAVHDGRRVSSDRQVSGVTVELGDAAARHRQAGDPRSSRTSIVFEGASRGPADPERDA